MADVPRKYAKPFLTLPLQIDLLEGRGLAITDKAAAGQFLAHVNYYRFSAYCIPFENPRHVFLPGVRFEQVVALYEFDKNLRALVAEVSQSVEISMRTTVAYYLGSLYGPFAHTDPKNFTSEDLSIPGKFSHRKWLEELGKETRRSKETFVDHFEERYAEYPNLPIWTAVEVMSFGTLSTLFSGLLPAAREGVARQYQLHPRILKSWLHALVYIRNVCAHHARLWNRHLSIAPKLPGNDLRWSAPPSPNPSRIATVLFMLNSLATTVPHVRFDPAGWRHRIELLLQDDLGVPNFYARMGFPIGWTKHPLWVPPSIQK